VERGWAQLAAAAPGATYLGGGTNLVDLMREGIEQPDTVVDVTALPLDTVEDLPGSGLRIGALVRNSAPAADGRVRARYPVLSQALLAGASGQLRNMATVGGNLPAADPLPVLLRPRCGVPQTGPGQRVRRARRVQSRLRNPRGE